MSRRIKKQKKTLELKKMEQDRKIVKNTETVPTDRANQTNPQKALKTKVSIADENVLEFSHFTPRSLTTSQLTLANSEDIPKDFTDVELQLPNDSGTYSHLSPYSKKNLMAKKKQHSITKSNSLFGAKMKVAILLTLITVAAITGVFEGDLPTLEDIDTDSGASNNPSGGFSDLSCEEIIERFESRGFGSTPPEGGGEGTNFGSGDRQGNVDPEIQQCLQDYFSEQNP